MMYQKPTHLLVVILGLAAVISACGDAERTAQAASETIADHLDGSPIGPTSGTVETAATDASPPWCEAGEVIEGMHGEFHLADEQLSAIDDPQALIAAAETIAEATFDPTLADNANLFKEAVGIAAATGDTAVFAERRYLDASFSLFDDIERWCS